MTNLQFASHADREIIRRDSGIKWADIQGNESTKQLLYDTVVMPLNYPGLFKGIIRPWHGILLHGPSGTENYFEALVDIPIIFFHIFYKFRCRYWKDSNGESTVFGNTGQNYIFQRGCEHDNVKVAGRLGEIYSSIMKSINRRNLWFNPNV